MSEAPRKEIPPPKGDDDFEDLVLALYRKVWKDPGARRAPGVGAPLPVPRGSRPTRGAGPGFGERDRVWAAGARGAVVGGDGGQGLRRLRVGRVAPPARSVSRPFRLHHVVNLPAPGHRPPASALG